VPITYVLIIYERRLEANQFSMIASFARCTIRNFGQFPGLDK
jgi:hypothetical protein